MTIHDVVTRLSTKARLVWLTVLALMAGAAAFADPPARADDPRPSLELGAIDELFQRHQYDKAVDRYKEWLTTFPDAADRPLVQLNLAISYNSWRDALVQAAAAGKATDQSQVVTCALECARNADLAAAALKDDPEHRVMACDLAAQAWVEVFRLKPAETAPLASALGHLLELAKDPAAQPEQRPLLRASEMEIFLQRFTEAEGHLKSYRQAAPADARAIYVQGRLDHFQGKHAETVAAFQQYLATNPADLQAKADALHLCALSWRESRKGTPAAAEAVALLTQAIQAGHPEPGALEFQRGQWLFEDGKPDESLAAFLKAAEVDTPVKADALHWAGVIQAGRGNTQPAVKFFRRALACNPPEPLRRELNERLAVVLFNSEEHRGALEVVKKALAETRQSGERKGLLKMVAPIVEELKKHQSAVPEDWRFAQASSHELVPLVPDAERATALLAEAEAASHVKDWNTVRSICPQVIKASGRTAALAQAYLLMGNASLEEKAWNDAIAWFGKAEAVRLNSEPEANAGYLHGEALHQLDRREEAVDQLVMTAGAYKSGHPFWALRCWYRAAQILPTMGRAADAVVLYRKAVGLETSGWKPTDEASRKLLAECRRRAGHASK